MSFLLVGGKTVDGFEDGDIAEYAGDTGSFSVQTSTVAEGSYALEGSSSGFITSHSGLQDYPRRGQTWKVNVRYHDSGAQPNIWFCVADEGSPGSAETGYYFEIDQSNGNLSMWEYDGANYNRFILVGSIGSHANEWLTVELTHNSDDSMDIALKDFDETTTYGSGSGTPSNVFRSSGGIKIRKRGTGNQYIDDWRII